MGSCGKSRGTVHGGGRVVWERPNVRLSEALCSLGLVRYVDMYGGTDDEGRGDWLENGISFIT